MHFRTYLNGLAILALSLAFAVPGHAALLPRADDLGHGGTADSLKDRRGAPVILAQAADPRVSNLEEELRRLNGRVEELNFQILQMQDQIRRMQEDNEFRFQQLEEKRSDAGGSAATQRAESAPAPANGSEGGDSAGTAPAQGEPPRTLGTITFDENGNVVSEGSGEPIDLLQGGDVQGSGAPSDGSVVAALPPSDNPDEIYRNAYEFILSGDYDTAEAGFRQYLDGFPDGAHAADAQFWLGEALLAQHRYREAAETFLQANRNHPNAGKAPDMLLKLGVSLAALDQRDVACATFTEIGQRYPQVSDALRERIRQEQEKAGC
ncbi:tol-pal system protein YbgF [Chelativorans sp. M5D2P16]|uniref:tol-pal system protein YbgF n=1 Tax=Chelativorans sp. M5D2P16 TaxID=3095678 RepID=UPI002ACA1A50|nr:tol-pal system protein YbgF [Chelativorans sp. M5D2P16]MDZ5699176.1 tol-pal system protein YbgF [Chelativorans sp. M5D2P16]